MSRIIYRSVDTPTKSVFFYGNIPPDSIDTTDEVSEHISFETNSSFTSQ